MYGLGIYYGMFAGVVRIFKRENRRKRIALFLLLAIVAGAIAFYAAVVFPTIRAISTEQTRAVTLQAINRAGVNIRSFEGFYGEFYEYHKNEAGDIVLITSNHANINAMMLFAQKEIQDTLDAVENWEIRVPLGAFSGSAFLSEFGPEITMTVLPVGTVQIGLHSYFFSEGINQTLHRIVMRIETTSEIMIPFKTETVRLTTDLLISEDVIVGKVPDSYITGISEDNIFDLFN